MDVGRGPPFLTTIYPFFDAPGVGVEVLFYHASQVAPEVGLFTPFVSRVWDAKENMANTPIGTDVQDRRIYTGNVPPAGWVMASGTPDQWLNGCSYARWLAGGYGKNCPNWVIDVSVTDVFCDDDSITVNPHTGHVILHVNLGHQFGWTFLHQWLAQGPLQTMQQIKLADMHTADAWQLLDHLNNKLAYFGGDGSLVLNSGVILNTDANPGEQAIVVNRFDTPQFAIGNAGQIVSNQIQPLAVIGTPIGAIPIYDPGGVSLGIIPIYAPPPSVLISDSFAADEVPEDLPPHLPDIGGPWVAHSNPLTIYTSFQIQSKATVEQIAEQDCGQSDVTITVHEQAPTILGGTRSGLIGIIFRWTSISNWWGLFIDETGIYGSGLWKMVGGSPTLAGPIAYTPHAGIKQLKVVANGDQIEGTIEGVSTIITDSFNQTATHVGMRANVANAIGDCGFLYDGQPFVVTNP